MSLVSGLLSVVEVIPSINVRTFAEVKGRIKKVEPFVQWCHLDVTDGIFSKHPTWHDPRDLPALDTALNAEAHLMIAEPEKIIDQWLVKPIKRVIVHVEAAKDTDVIIEKCRAVGVEIGLAVNPETSWERLEPWFEKVDMVQVLAVHPGPSGQEPDFGTYEKVARIRSACLHCVIEVDGGVNFDSAPRLVAAGANILVSGAAIFGARDIGAAVAALKEHASS